jgi:hypothetical protein
MEKKNQDIMNLDLACIGNCTFSALIDKKRSNSMVLFS